MKCECGRTLQAPATAVGKAVKCPCGKALRVAANESAASGARQATAAAKPIAVRSASAAEQQSTPRSSVATASALATRSGPDPFASISDDEWQSLLAKNAPRVIDEKPKEKTATHSLLEQARTDLGVNKKARQSGAKGYLASSRWILIGIGALKLVISLIQLYLLNSTMESLEAEAGELDLDMLRFVIQVICGISIGIAMSFILMGALVFLFPMTCTITAMCLFVLTEIGGLIANPFMLINIRAWVVRIAMGGALVQAINNAAYYKYIRAESRKRK